MSFKIYVRFAHTFPKEKRKKTAKKNKKESHITGGQGRAVKVFAKKILPEPINYFPLKKVRCGDFFAKLVLTLIALCVGLCVPTYLCLLFCFLDMYYYFRKNNAVSFPLLLFRVAEIFWRVFLIVRWLSSLTARNGVSTGNVLMCVGSKTMTKNLCVGYLFSFTLIVLPSESQTGEVLKEASPKRKFSKRCIQEAQKEAGGRSKKKRLFSGLLMDFISLSLDFFKGIRECFAFSPNSPKGLNKKRGASGGTPD